MLACEVAHAFTFSQRVAPKVSVGCPPILPCVPQLNGGPWSAIVYFTPGLIPYSTRHRLRDAVGARTGHAGAEEDWPNARRHDEGRRQRV